MIPLLLLFLSVRDSFSWVIPTIKSVSFGNNDGSLIVFSRRIHYQHQITRRSTIRTRKGHSLSKKASEILSRATKSGRRIERSGPQQQSTSSDDTDELQVLADKKDEEVKPIRTRKNPSEEQQQHDHEKMKRNIKSKNKRKKSSTLIGGDYAGLYYTFDHKDGSLIPIPDYLIPHSMLEWGDIPTSLEVLISEDDYNHDNKSMQIERRGIITEPRTAPLGTCPTWNRHTLTILPETGCGVDNLETVKTSEASWKVVHVHEVDGGNAFSLLYELSTTNKLRFETIFRLPQTIINDDISKERQHRARVQVDLVLETGTDDVEDIAMQETGTDDDDDIAMVRVIQHQPIRVYLERQVSSCSSNGTLADGGGLDGRTVHRMLGKYIREKQNEIIPQQLFPLDDEGGWQNGEESIDHDNMNSRNSDDDDDDIRSFRLLGNLDVSYSIANEGTEWIKMGFVQTSGSRQTVLLTFEDGVPNLSSFISKEEGYGPVREYNL